MAAAEMESANDTLMNETSDLHSALQTTFKMTKTPTLAAEDQVLAWGTGPILSRKSAPSSQRKFGTRISTAQAFASSSSSWRNSTRTTLGTRRSSKKNSVWLGHRGALDQDANIVSSQLRHLAPRGSRLPRSMPDLHANHEVQAFDFGMSCTSNPFSKLGVKNASGELGRDDPRKGVIRDIHILGIIAGNLMLAFKGQGFLKVHLEHHSTDGLNGMIVVWEKAYNKYLPKSKTFDYMEFQVPSHLPATIEVIGETDPEYKPLKESRLRARISTCGQVSRATSHLAS